MENTKDSSPTDELPVLTEVDEGHADAASDDLDPTHEFDTLETLEDTATLRQVVELRAALEDRDAMIASLGERLAATREAVRRRDATERSLRRHLTDADRLRAGLEQRVAELERGGAGGASADSHSRTGETDGKTGGGADAEHRSIEAALRESRDAYAALSAYVDGRRRFWDAQNARIEDLEAKVRELDAELKQRIRREREAIDAAHREARRAEQLARLLAAVRHDLRGARTTGGTLARPTGTFESAPVAGTLEPEQHDGAAAPDPRNGAPESDRRTDTLEPGGRTDTLEPDRRTDTLEPDRRTDTLEPASSPDANRPSGRPPARRRVMLCLADTPPSEYPLDGRTMIIGRGSECDITVATDFMSRQHARLGITAGRVTIEDLGSRNGVLVNSIRVERAILQNGDFITLGETLFRYIED